MALTKTSEHLSGAYNSAGKVIAEHSGTDPLIDRYRRVRQQTEVLVAPLSEADAQLQAMPDVSPSKWHLAHTTWFFETFILCCYQENYSCFNNGYNYLFNSYYNGIGKQYPRSQRGLISRPSLQEILAYRHAVDTNLLRLISNQSDNQNLLRLVELGLQHEQQHQELLLTDIKYNLFQNPLLPPYTSQSEKSIPSKPDPLNWLAVDGGLTDTGYADSGFSFDNERPAHKVYINDYQIASRLVTNGEYLTFLEAGGYLNPNYWLADGWAWLQESQQRQPLYWVKKEGHWYEFSLHGLIPLALEQPVIHVNYYEACAYANWMELRLPTEFEWENALRQLAIYPVARDIDLHPLPDEQNNDFFGRGWQWTASGYSAYPGFKPFSGVAGEYNGKFMSSQLVLRGSSCVTPRGHARLTYRNFFYPHQCWQFSSIRLAK